MHPMNKITSTSQEGYTTLNSNSRHEILADEPLDLGGNDKGFTPGELLLASLASCTSITMKMYANRKEWELPTIKIEAKMVEGEKQYIEKKIVFEGELEEAQIEKLLIISKKCPMHKILERSMEIVTIS